MECHIWIKTGILGHANGSIQSKLAFRTRPDRIVTKTDLSYWHLVAFIIRKMILANLQYEIHNGKILAIVKVFKIWRQYLESYKHEVFVFSAHNNLHHS